MRAWNSFQGNYDILKSVNSFLLHGSDHELQGSKQVASLIKKRDILLANNIRCVRMYLAIADTLQFIALL